MHNIHNDETERDTQIKRAESDKTYDIYFYSGTPGLWFDDPPLSLLDIVFLPPEVSIDNISLKNHTKQGIKSSPLKTTLTTY